MAGTILLIGATEADGHRLAGVLDRIGCQVSIRRVENPEQAAAALGAGPSPALVLLEEVLVGESSVPVLEEIRTHVDLDLLPVVVLIDEAPSHDRGFSRLGSAMLVRQADDATYHEQVERIAERFLTDWVVARPMPGHAGPDRRPLGP
jgi:hypothetical protein